MEEASDRSFLSSPRNQRRVLVAALVVFAIGVATLTFVFFRNTGDPTETFSNEPADIFKPQKTTKIDPDARRRRRQVHQDRGGTQESRLLL